MTGTQANRPQSTWCNDTWCRARLNLYAASDRQWRRLPVRFLRPACHSWDLGMTNLWITKFRGGGGGGGGMASMFPPNTPPTPAVSPITLPSDKSPI